MPLGPLANLHACHLRFKYLFLLRFKTCATHVCSHDYSWPNSQRTHQALLRHQGASFHNHTAPGCHSSFGNINLALWLPDNQTTSGPSTHSVFIWRILSVIFFINVIPQKNISSLKDLVPWTEPTRMEKSREMVRRLAVRTSHERPPIRWTPSPSVRPNWSESWTKSRRGTSHKSKLWCSTRRANWTMDERTRNSRRRRLENKNDMNARYNILLWNRNIIQNRN